jgi:hypothetical protein
MPSQSPFEQRQTELNPHRDADRERASEVAYSQLRQRGIEVEGTEDSDVLANLLSAVERFENAVIAMGGDRMVNEPDTEEPENEQFVRPRRNDDEPLEAYTNRLLEAADRLESSRPA